MLKDNESTLVVQAIIDQFLAGHEYTKQDIDKILSDLQSKVNSDFMALVYVTSPSNPVVEE